MNKFNHRTMLVNPPGKLYRHNPRCQSQVDSQAANIYFPPLDLMQLAAILNKYKIESQIKDYPLVKPTKKILIKDLNDFSPKIVLINSTTLTYKDDIRYISLVKKINSKITTILKGGNCAIKSKDIIASSEDIDIIIKQQPEECIEALAKNDFIPTRDIKALTYKENGYIYENDNFQFLPNIDKFPLPDRTKIDNKLYRNPYNNLPFTTINIAQGCVYDCLFCPAGVLSNYQVRYKSVKKVIEEIKQCHYQFKINDFLFDADSFTYDRNYVLRLCSSIKESKLNIRWTCNSRVNNIDDELAREMKQAGCWIIGFGIESGDSKILKKIGKQISLTQAKSAIKICHKHKISTLAFFVIGFPWDSYETINKTYKFIKKINSDYFDVNIAVPLPGTRLYEMVINNNLIKISDLARCSYSSTKLRTHYLNHRQLNTLRRKILFKLLLRPNYLFKFLNAEKRGPVRLKNYLIAGLNLWRRL